MYFILCSDQLYMYRQFFVSMQICLVGLGHKMMSLVRIREIIRNSCRYLSMWGFFAMASKPSSVRSINRKEKLRLHRCLQQQIEFVLMVKS